VTTNSTVRYNQNLPLARLKEFYALIEHLKTAKQLIAYFTHVSADFKSKRLLELITIVDESVEGGKGIFPDIDSAVSEFEALISWQSCNNYKDEKVPEPVKGFDKDYDKSKKMMAEVQKELGRYLSDTRAKLGHRRCYEVKYVHAKLPYEIEVPEYMVKDKIPPEFEFTSARIGFKRFMTPEILKMVK
jgi:hypothetical protein